MARETLKNILIFLLSFPAFSVKVLASDLTGHFKYQPSVEIHDSDSIASMLGADVTHTHTLDLRTRYFERKSNFSFSATLETLGIGGSGIEQRGEVISRVGSSTGLLPDDDNRLVTLRLELLDEDSFEAVSGFDRLVLDYQQGAFLIRVGRQAVSWGNGLSFSVLDVFNPFSPTEVDRDYKPGDDMLLAQYLFSNGVELNFLAVGRRDESGDVLADSCSFATRLTAQILPLEMDVEFIGAAHYSDPFFGAGFSKNLFNGVLRLDLSYLSLDTDSHSSVFDILVNYDRSWTVFDYNLYTFIEYFHSGAGLEQEQYSELSQALQQRVLRSEIFLIAKEYAATGIRVELSELWMNTIALVANLHDESGIVQNRLDYSWRQNLDIVIGLDLPWGSAGSEFGGVQFSDFSATIGPSPRGYLRFAYYY